MSRKKQIARLDKLWSRAVVERDNYICQKCGDFGDNPHHVAYKIYLAVRHVLVNGLTLCTDCHINAAHAYPECFEIWFAKEYPDRYEEIERRKHELKPDLDKIEMELKEGM